MMQVGMRGGHSLIYNPMHDLRRAYIISYMLSCNISKRVIRSYEGIYALELSIVDV